MVMTAPHTTLDSRFSDPGAQPTGWERTCEILAAAELFWLSTVRGDGRPHVTPLVAVWSGDRLHFCTGPEEQKALNLGHHPHVVLSTGCNTWERGLDVMVEGEATRITEPDELRRLAAAWTTKWDGRWKFDVGDEGFAQPDSATPVWVFSVAPSKVLVFGKGEFTHTSHRF